MCHARRSTATSAQIPNAFFIWFPMASEKLQALSSLIAVERSSIEGRGVRVDGYGGGSQEGPVWHYDFSISWPHPPDRASVRISLWWQHYAGDEPDQVEVTRAAEIFREGQPSRFKDVAKSEVSVRALLESGLEKLVQDALNEGRAVIGAAQQSN